MLANLEKSGYLLPTPVQIATMDSMQQGTDLLVTAVTGSGKTVAYLAPTISKFMGKWKKVCKPRPNPARYNPDTDRIRAARGARKRL